MEVIDESSGELLAQIDSEQSRQSPMDLEFDEEPSDPVFKFMNGEITFNDYLNEMEQVSDIKDSRQHTVKTELSSDDKFVRPVDKKKAQKSKRSKLSATLRALMGQANVSYAKGDKQAAVKMCLEIIKEAPEASEPFKMLATVYEEMNEHEKSLQMRLIAAHLGPASKEEWAELAQWLKSNSQFRQAVICLTRAINLDDTNLYFYDERAEMMKKAGVSCVEAYGYLRLLHKLDPKTRGSDILDLSKKVAQIYYGEKKFEKTISTLKYAFDNCPKHITDLETNLYLDVLTMTRNYRECLNVLTSFCKIEMDIETVEDSVRITKCVVPDDLPIDIRAKLIITLICSDSMDCASAQIDVLLTENPDETGDLFWDVGLILCEKKFYNDAIKVLYPLTSTKKFNFVGLWLKLTQCYKETGRIEECHRIYRCALEYFPEDNDLKLKFCDELIAARRYQEAVEVTRSDGKDITLLIYERCKLYLLLAEYDNFLESGWQLFRQHCKEIKTSEDYVIFTSVYTMVKGLSSILSQYVPAIVDTSVSLDEEWKIYWEMCRVYIERKEYDMFLLLTVSLHVSFKFIPARNELKMPLIVACIMNNNCELGFDVIRDIIHHKKMNTNRLWNTLYICSLKTEYSRLHKFVIRFLKSHPHEDRAVMMYANDSLYAGTYKYALNDHTILYEKYKTSLLALLVGINFLHISCQKFTTSKHALVSQTLAFFSEYERLRGEDASQEIYYNIGRLFHQLQLLPQAIFYYKKSLNCKPAIKNSAAFDLRHDIAYNLHLIYLYSNQSRIANMYLQKYVVI